MKFIKKLFNSLSDLVLEFDEKSMSYTRPVKKLLISLILILLSIFRIKVDNKVIDTVLTLLAVACIIVAIMCVLTSLYTIFFTFSNLRKSSEKQLKRAMRRVRTYPYKKFIALLKDNENISVKIIYRNKLVEVCVNSDGKSSEPLDKRYFIKNRKFDNFDKFEEALKAYFDDGKVKVMLIDNLSPIDWERLRADK